MVTGKGESSFFSFCAEADVKIKIENNKIIEILQYGPKHDTCLIIQLLKYHNKYLWLNANQLSG